MTINKALFSSEKMNWETPKWLFDFVKDIVGGFDCDVAADEYNTLCYNFFTAKNSAFNNQWHDLNWCNPTYGRTISKWIDRAIDQYEGGCETVMLIPARTDTKYFSKIFDTADHVLFIKGRLKFTIGGVEQQSAPFPSALVFFHSLNKAQKRKFSEIGKVVDL